jgi:hypothetical protein
VKILYVFFLLATTTITISTVLPLNVIFQQQVSFAVKVYGPFVTKYIDDVDGSDIFKITVGLAGLTPETGVVEVCATPSLTTESKVCNMLDASRDFLNDFPMANCSTCIITVGTFVFPKNDVPVNSEINICATTTKSQTPICKTASNGIDKNIENIVVNLK